MKVYILRSLPGGGKSTFAKTIKNAVICSADDTHMIDGVYRFVPANIRKAHSACKRKYHSILERTCEELHEQLPDFLIVDNTNISSWETAFFYDAAELFGCEVKILTFWCTPELSMKRNTHNVPATTILSMYQRLLTETLPPHWNHEIIMSKE